MSETTLVTVPNIGDASDVEVIEVSIQVGQQVEAEDQLITLESDKAAMDIPSPVQGIIKELKVNPGDKVSEGDAVALIELIGDIPSAKAPEQSDQAIDSESSKVTDPTPKANGSTSLQSLELTLPDLGTDDEVTVIEQMVQVGDEVNDEQPLLSLESDKAAMDVPSTQKGKVTSWLIQVGDKVKSNQPFIVIETLGQSAPVSQAKPAPQESKESPSGPQPTPATKSMTATQDGHSYVPASGQVHAGPSSRRLAAQLGVDLAKVKGSGRKGRILVPDVHAYVKQTLTGSGHAQGIGIEPMPEIDFSRWGEVTTTPLNRIKRLTAKNLHRNWVNIPHVTQFDEADITELEDFRQANKGSAKEMGINLTPLAFIIKACVSSLQAFPQFNASLASNGQDLILKHYFHIGVAVDTPNGLVVPVIRDCENKGLFSIAQELGELSIQAREGRLKREQMQGSCFTISSLGPMGGTQFTPIINAPDVAILGVSKASMKPVYEQKTFVPKLMLPLALSYDHRVIDGVEGAKFMKHLCAQLQDIRKLLL